MTSAKKRVKKCPKCAEKQYRATLVVEYFGWVNLDLGSFPGW